MKQFQRNDVGLIEKTIREMVQEQKIGRVTRVYEHREEDDDSNFEVDVELPGGLTEESLAPASGPWANSIAPPRVGDKVVVSYLAGETSRPFISQVQYTNEDRPPVGKAGMVRDRYESGDSPAGSGDLYVTKYTGYDDAPGNVDKDDLTAEDTFIQIAKRQNNSPDPRFESDLPAKIEFYDSPGSDEAHIVVELNKVNGVDSSATWGIKFDLKTGEFKLLDPEGYGIVSDGNGNFTWHYDSIDFSEDTTTSL